MCQPPRLRKMEEMGGEKDREGEGASTRDKNDTPTAVSLTVSLTDEIRAAV